jgi:hypothetical protein
MYPAAFAANNALKDPDQVSKQMTIRHLNAKQLIQHWGTLPQERQGPRVSTAR